MPHKLLLADDSITIQKVVELVLAEEEFEIKSVGNGEDALKLVASFKPDVVLADIEMPKMNGYQLCEKIKQNPVTAHIPVILLAGAFEPVDAAVASKVGADDSVIKPFESQELISKLNAALTISESVAAVAAPVEEEVFAIAEEAADLGEEPAIALEEEAMEVPVSAEEDLWAMEEEPGVPEAIVAGVETAEPVAAEEPAAIAEVEEEIFVLPEEEEPLAALDEEPFAVSEEEPLAVAAEEAFGIPEEEPFAILEEEVIAEPAPPVFEEIAAQKPQPVRETVPPREVRVPEPVTAQVAVPQAALPSREEFLAIYQKSIDEKVSAALASMDMKGMLINSLMPSLKDSIEKILWEIAPDLTEKMLKEILKGSVASLTAQVEKVIWETVPDLASTMISKEIERIKSEI